MARSAPGQMGALRSMYESTVDEAALTAKVTPDEMHAALQRRDALYTEARLAGQTPDEAFDTAGTGAAA